TRKYPELNFNMAFQKGNYKLVGMTDSNASIDKFELFNLKEDPFEEKNLILENKELANSLKSAMTKTYIELITSKNIVNPPLINVGDPLENPVILNRNDAGGDRGIWDQEEIFGKWAVKIETGTYQIKYKFIKPVEGGGKVVLETGGKIHQQVVNEKKTDMIILDNVQLEEMEVDLIPFYSINNKRIFPFWVSIEKKDETSKN
ncbi:MAG: arylsulfatase, partial [Eudoraea sp.]